MAAARWFIARNKEKVGPFSAGDMQQLARYGLLQPEEHVLVDGATKWVPASSVPGLFRAVADKKYWLQLEGQTRGPFVADQVRAAFESQGYRLRTGAPFETLEKGHHLIEVYPHPALLRLASQEERLCYKVAKTKKYWPQESLEQRKTHVVRCHLFLCDRGKPGIGANAHSGGGG